MLWQPAFTVRLPYPPSVNAVWHSRVLTAKKGANAGRQIVSTFTTHEARKYKESVGWILRQAGMRQPFTCRVRLDMQLWPHCPQDWKKRMKADPLWWADTVKRIDLDNANKVLIDALKGIAIVDDDQVWKLTGEVMEPQQDVPAGVVMRLCCAVKDDPQAAIPMQPQVMFP